MTQPEVSEFSNLHAVLLVSFFALFFYQWGAANLEGFSVYPTTRVLGQFLTTEEWIAVREGPFLRIFPLLVIPFALSILATIALVISHPPFVPRSVLLAILGLQAVRAISTVIVQVPIQVHLNTGFDLAATNRLIVTDLWLRKLPLHLEGALALCLLWIVVARR
jgi:hypothetical protein